MLTTANIWPGEISIPMCSVRVAQMQLVSASSLLIMLSLSLDHFCSWINEVLVPIFSNEDNISRLPECVANGEI